VTLIKNKTVRIALIYLAIFLISSPVMSLFFINIEITSVGFLIPFFMAYFLMFFLSLLKNLKGFHMSKTKIIIISIMICCSAMAVGNIGFGKKMWLPFTSATPDNVQLGGTMTITHERGSNVIDYDISLLVEASLGLNEGTYTAFLYGLNDGNSSYLSNGSYYVDTNFTCIENADLMAETGDTESYCSKMSAKSQTLLLNNSVETTTIFQPVFSGTLSDYNSTWGTWNSVHNQLSTTTDAYILIEYRLHPIVNLESEHFNSGNIRCEIWDMTMAQWVEQTFTSIHLSSPYYRLRLYDLASDYLIYEDGSDIIYTKNRTVAIATLKMINYSGEPVTFHVSESTTTYDNATYWNSADLVTMFTGTKNSSVYSNLDYSDFDSLLLEPVGTPSGGTAPVTVDWYPEDSSFVNGTVAVEDYDYFILDDTDYFTIYPTYGTTQVDYVWSTEYYYPTGSSYTYGSSSSSYSDMDTSNDQYYSILSDSSSQVSDYIWALEHIYPTDGYAVNGSTFSAYASMDEADLDYFVWLANTESVLNGDFEWAFEKWYATSDYYTYGSSAEAMSNLEIDDDLFYNILSASDSTQTDYIWALEHLYPTSGYFTNGSTSSAYSLMNQEDLSNFIAIANTESVLNGDFEWAFEDWYADNSAWINGSTSGAYSDMYAEGGSAYSIASNSEGTPSSFSSAEEEWYVTNSAYINGTGNNPYSYMELDNDQYYYAVANSEHGSAVDYVWYNDDWYPLDSSLL